MYDGQAESNMTPSAFSIMILFIFLQTVYLFCTFFLHEPFLDGKPMGLSSKFRTLEMQILKFVLFAYKVLRVFI